MGEIWKDVKGFEELYFVSNMGRVKSADRICKFIRSGKSCSMTKYGRILRQKVSWDGYYEVCLFKDSKRKYVRVHRLVAQANLRNKLCLKQVNHKDGDKLNNHWLNLEWCTQQENTIHAYKNGLINNARGEAVSNLKNDEVKRIREFYKSGLISQIDIAKRYGVGKNCIWNIIWRKTWKHI